MQLLRNNYQMRANVFAILFAASGRAMKIIPPQPIAVIHRAAKTSN
jgi:hypothetical protein